MPSPTPKPVSLAQIEDTSREFDVLVNQVSAQVQGFLKWFNSLPGRTEVAVFDDDEMESGPRMGLRIGRSKDWWQLYYCFYDFGSEEPSWSLLDTAPLQVRCGVLVLLPKLIGTMHSEQSEMLGHLKVAKKVLDQLSFATAQLPKEGR